MQPCRGGPSDTFKRRAKTSENATQKHEAQLKEMRAQRMREALSKFDENLVQAQQAKYREYDDIDEASTLGGQTATSETSPPVRTVGELRALSAGGHGGQVTRTTSMVSKVASMRGREGLEVGHRTSQRMNSRMNSRNSAHDAADVVESPTSPVSTMSSFGGAPKSRLGEDLITARKSMSTAEQVARRQAVCAKKPPSPLSFYDYGCVTVKARSVTAQHRGKLGESIRSEHRRSSPGFLFPGPHFERGPYGFSIIDPMLLPARCTAGQPVPEHWPRSPGDVRPNALQDLRAERARRQDPVISPTVRTTAAHSKRSLLAFHHMDKRKEEDVLEQVIFENGVYEGRWRDPSWDNDPTNMLQASATEEHTWVSKPVAEMSEAQRAAMRVLYGLENALSKWLGRLPDLFVSEMHGSPGLLELQGFKRGLVKSGALGENDMTMNQLREVACALDPNFDGRVSIRVLARALNALRNLEDPPPAHLLGVQEFGSKRMHRQEEDRRSDSGYGDAVPVDPVRLNYKAGLYNFSKSLASFKTQQGQLTSHYST